jgi:hypothetical protein
MLPGCVGMSAEERVAVQEEQLVEMVAQADGWGGEIIAQIPVAEHEPAAESRNMGGSRQASDYEEWPKYYYWDPIIVLRAEGARTPTEVADDLEPWLEAEGWERNEGSEFPPGEESFERDYYREGYHLVVEVYTEAPPRAQSINFTIVTPQTDPDHG